jgi:hypothetical protein
MNEHYDDRVDERGTKENPRPCIGEAVALVADERDEDYLGRGIRPAPSAEHPRYQAEFYRAMGEQVDADEAGGSRREMLSDVGDFPCDDVSRLVGQFLAGPESEKIADPAGADEQDRAAADYFQQPVDTLEDDGAEKEAVLSEVEGGKPSAYGGHRMGARLTRTFSIADAEFSATGNILFCIHGQSPQD